MLLKPATPLSVLLLVAFLLLLLSVLSTPVIKSIPIATFENVRFGVFGYCQGSDCSGIRVGYPADGIFGDSNRDGDFNLPATIRHTLSALLIVHPIAAFLAFICFALAAAAHLHSPSHSPRYLLGLLILLLPTLLVSLLAFLVDILLFVPYLQWGGWIVLGATILLTSSGVVTCAMRRTLVSRKARKRRIAENAEMSGENYYNRQIVVKVDVPPSSSPAPSQPQTTAAATTGNGFNPSNDDGYRRNGSPGRLSPPEPAGYPQPPRLSPEDNAGVPLQDPYGSSYPTQSNPNLRNQFSNTSMRSIRSDGSSYRQRGRAPPYPPPRGRGRPPGGPRAFPPGGRGRGPPRPGPSRRGRGRPPPGYPPQSRGYPANDYLGYGPGRRYGDRSDFDQGIEMQTPPNNIPGGHRDPATDNLKSPTSIYSADALAPSPYVPPRTNWTPQEYPSLELPTNQRPPLSPLGPSTQPRDMTRSPPNINPHPPSSYYEDVEPRFALPMNGVESADVPSSLVPGSSGEPLLQNSSDGLPGGARSSAVSEASHFTSISQRGINPKWRPADSENPKPKIHQRQDVLLSSNPDFALPTGRARANTATGGRMPAPSMPTIPGTPTGYRSEQVSFLSTPFIFGSVQHITLLDTHVILTVSIFSSTTHLGMHSRYIHYR
ncbi:pH-response regulator protein palI/RIM9 [Coccidioides immitis RMSCC 3703]|uniref:pH-response regulator protein palI/RIM9 n=1 Tax=Coccidioides immitis RMSCC 3703 TaxID=454286 RepID=A0A0J8U2H4_COCIT|nr:pH-response regulator protein palI/RIM9 [Coccidioides immitis RMSCC 3703]